jgi:hypothetical protein
MDVKAKIDGLDHRRDGWTAHLSDAHLREMNRRLLLVRHWRAYREIGRECGITENQVTRAFLSLLRSIGVTMKVNRSSLFQWDKALRYDGNFGLADLRHFKSKPQADWPFIKALTGIYLDNARHGCGWIEFCHDRTLKLAVDYNWPRCTLRESEEWIKGNLEPSKSHAKGGGSIAD